MDTMVITEDEALRVLILINYYFHHEKFTLSGNPSAENLGEVQLARKIARELPELKSNAELALEGK